MASNSLTRLSTASAYSSALDQLAQRQKNLATLQEQLSASKSVLRASDNPAAAAQAEMARTRMARITTDQRALDANKDQLSSAESTLGSAGTLMQSLRELVVKAGSSIYSDSDRASMAQQMSSLRDQILSLANAKDTSGQPLFGGIGSTTTPFSDSASGVTFNGLAGQAAATATSVPGTLDGFSTWMNVPTGNGVFTVTQGAGTTGVNSDQGQVTDATALTGHNYSIDFTVTGGVTTYSVTDTTLGTTVQSNQPYTTGNAIAFDGLSLVPQGTPANGDSLQIADSTRSSVFDTIDRAIAAVKSSNGTLSQGIARSLTEIDSAMSRLSAARGQAGDSLNRMDSITDAQSAKSVQLEAQRSSAEDLDLVKGYSDFTTQQTTYSAALQSYAKIQQLSLFNFLG